MDIGTHLQSGACVDTVRALHQTIVSLRAALEKSRSEILELKSRNWTPDNGTNVNRDKITRQLKEKQLDNRERRNSDYGENICVATEGTASKSVENRRQLKKELSKSQTVCYSNVFDGEKRISSSNSLHVNKPRKSAQLNKFKKSGKNLIFLEEDLDQLVGDKIENNEKAPEIALKEKQNLDIYRRKKSANKSAQKKRNLAKRIGFTSSDASADEINENFKRKNKSQVKSHKSKAKSCEATIKNESDDKIAGDKSEVVGKCDSEIGDRVVNDEKNSGSDTKSNKEPSQDLGKKIELALFGEVHNQNINDVSAQIVSLEAQDLAPIKTDDIKDNVEKNIFCNEIAGEPLTQAQQTVDSSEGVANKTSINSNNQVNDDASPEKSNTSESSALSNLEISVKIFKGSRKPLEVDIKTKKIRKTMNDKSQNTSFDDDNFHPLPNNEVQSSCVQNSNSNTSQNIGNMIQNNTEQEVDDIELIFTTDDTKETDFKEELVPIEPYRENQLLPRPLSDYDDKSAESDRELEDDVFNDNFENENQENCNFQSQTFEFHRENSQLYNSKSDNSINHDEKSLKSYYSYQDSSFENRSLEKDESFDRFEEKVRIVETDISKIGIQDVEYNVGRRNTCPNPLQYRPIMHREALGRGLNSRKCRPVLAHSNVVRKESGAQTDISAIPGSSWRSESSLGHKVKGGDNFTTLPSKFPHPGSRLRLSEKTVEARRVLLSDIGFTSMVPELSRSADHLCPPNLRPQVVSSYGQFLATTDLYSPAYTSQKFMWTMSPGEGSHCQSRYSSQYPLSSPPAPARRCSAPVSPSRRTMLKTTPSKVRFANGSLPELRSDWTTTVDSGESTDSLVDEAEHFLRRSIDCLAPCRDVCFRSEHKQTGVRRASAPEPSRDNVPPVGWQPFLPRIPRDLHLDYWVKVISQEGRVRGGRVRYVGPLMTQTDQFVGVQLSTPDGHSDGTYNNRRYFNCEPHHGIFVPFKKIIMGWRP